MANNIPSYIDCILPECPVLFGCIKLKPFSIGHYLLMVKEKCKLIDCVPSDNVNDLLVGAAICSRTYEQFLQQKEDGSLELEFKKFGKTYDKLYKQGKANGFILEENRFIEYLIEESINKMPPFEWKLDTNHGEPKQEAGAYWAQQILLALTSKVQGRTFDQALNMPMSHAFYDVFSWCESQNQGKLLKQSDLDRNEELKNANKNLMVNVSKLMEEYNKKK